MVAFETYRHSLFSSWKAQLVFKKILFAAVPVAAVGALALGGVASAATAPSFTTAGVAAAAGWSVRSANVDFTHTQGRFGSSGDSSWENLPIASALASATTGEPITSILNNPGSLDGGIGAELCDTSQGAPGYAAQEGIVRVGPNSFDVIGSVGWFGPTAHNSNGDVCDNGLLGVAPGSHVAESRVLLTGVTANDTVDLNVLYNAKTNYHVTDERNHTFQVTRGHITFTTEDLSTGGIGFDDSIAGAFISPNFVTNEAAQGVVADTTAAIPLTGVTIPASNAGSLVHSAPNELIRVSHSAVAGNSIAVGGSEVQGSFFTNSAWNATPVASTRDGSPNSALYLDPSLVNEDNFYVAGGQGLVG